MDQITYSLETNQEKSDIYYKNIKSFTDKILKEFQRFDTGIIEDFIIYNQNTSKKLQQYDEYIFEILMIGTLCKYTVQELLN